MKNQSAILLLILLALGLESKAQDDSLVIGKRGHVFFDRTIREKNITNPNTYFYRIFYREKGSAFRPIRHNGESIKEHFSGEDSLLFGKYQRHKRLVKIMTTSATLFLLGWTYSTASLAIDQYLDDPIRAYYSAQTLPFLAAYLAGFELAIHADRKADAELLQAVELHNQQVGRAKEH